MLEHPAVLGLLLTREQRMYYRCLKIVDAAGTSRIETTQERLLRITWKKPIPITPSRTSGSFVEMDMTLFKRADAPAA